MGVSRVSPVAEVSSEVESGYSGVETRGDDYTRMQQQQQPQQPGFPPHGMGMQAGPPPQGPPQGLPQGFVKSEGAPPVHGAPPPGMVPQYAQYQQPPPGMQMQPPPGMPGMPPPQGVPPQAGPPPGQWGSQAMHPPPGPGGEPNAKRGRW